MGCPGSTYSVVIIGCSTKAAGIRTYVETSAIATNSTLIAFIAFQTPRTPGSGRQDYCLHRVRAPHPPR